MHRVKGVRSVRGFVFLAESTLALLIAIALVSFAYSAPPSSTGYPHLRAQMVAQDTLLSLSTTRNPLEGFALGNPQSTDELEGVIEQVRKATGVSCIVIRSEERSASSNCEGVGRNVQAESEIIFDGVSFHEVEIEVHYP